MRISFIFIIYAFLYRSQQLTIISATYGAKIYASHMPSEKSRATDRHMAFIW